MRRTNGLIALTCSTALALASSVLVAGPASADDIVCGTVITTSTALTHDLECDGTTDGLVIDADGIVLDLKGFTIKGPGRTDTSKAGIRVAQNANVTITSGTVTGWQSGVVLDEAWDSRVSKVTASFNDQNINLAGGGRHVVEKNTVLGSPRDGIRLGLSTGNLVTQNVVTDNVFSISVANGSSNNTVSRNVVTGAHSVGISVFDRTTTTTLSQNVVSGSWDDGIRTSSDTSGSLIIQNQAYANGGDGVEAANATVTKNLVTFNGQLGIRGLDGVVDGGGNKAAGNGDASQCTIVVCTAP